MKKLLYIAGVVIAVLAAVVLLDNRIMIRDGANAIAANTDDTTFAIKCVGADVMFSPTKVTAEITWSDPIAATVAVTGAVAGGTAGPAVIGKGESTDVGFIYLYFGQPKMRHIYSCQGVADTQTDLSWKLNGADNANLYVGYGTSAAAAEGDFTAVTGAYVVIDADHPKDAGAPPFFTWDDGDFRLMMKGKAEIATVSGVEETELITFQSVPKL